MKKLMKTFVTFALIAVLSVTSLALPAFADSDLAYGAATVNAGLLNIRQGPGYDYDVVDTVELNSIIVILEQTSSEWYKINYNGVVGYVCCEYLTDILIAENFSAAGTITKDGVRMRKTFSTDSDVLCTIKNGTEVSVIGINTGWYKIKYAGYTGYVRSDLMEVTGEASGTSTSAGSASDIGTQAANLALEYVGYDYVYGAESPSDGFDCSGLVYYVYKQFGYNLERRASVQYRTAGEHVSKSELVAGDLVFFSSNGSSVTHVGIYIGDNQFVHASTSKTGVIISNLDSAYYTRVWFGATRVV